MIILTRLNGAKYYLNADLIISIEETPDTMITLMDKTKLVVREPAAVVAERFIAFQQKVKNPAWYQPDENDQ